MFKSYPDVDTEINFGFTVDTGQAAQIRSRFKYGSGYSKPACETHRLL